MPSGNSVVLEQELMKSGEVRRSMEMNTAIVKAFHRMLMMTTR
jgi:flagellar basal-body rod protein FlgB